MALHPMTDKDYEAQGDIEALARAKAIEADPARLANAKRFADDKRQEYEKIAKSIPDRPKQRFNGAVRKSKMVKS